MKKLLLFAVMMLAVFNSSLKAQDNIFNVKPTKDRPVVKHVQSTGDTITYTTVGIHPEIYAQTLDGYTLWHTATGDIVYAMLDKEGQMIASQVLATDRRPTAEQVFLNSLPKRIRFKSDEKSPGNLLSGSLFPHNATRSDSLLVILVEFPDVQFSHGNALIENFFSQTGYDSTGSFKDYFYDQSGGRFDPGVRVVGPYMMSQNKNYYNQTGSYAQYLVRSAISAADNDVDYSHFDIDGNNNTDAILIFYAGEMPESNSEGLWPHESTVSGAGTHDGKTFAKYCMFDEGLPSSTPTIGTACHEFGHVLGLPDLYDVGYNGRRNPGGLNLMGGGNYNGGGKLPPNLSVIEKYLLGWGAIDTLQPGDSISVTALGTLNDRGWYLSTGDGQFFMFEARSKQNHWDSGLGFENEGGLIIYHGKDNWGTNNRVNYYLNDEGWYPIPCGANVMVWSTVDEVVFGNSYTSFTPNSAASPRQNDSTLLSNIWITDIHWTSDSTMAFAYDTIAPAYNIVDAVLLDKIIDVTNNGFVGKGVVVNTTGPLTAKGMVYASTAEECTLELGTAVYDTELSNDITITATVSNLEEGNYYYRMFVTAGGITAYSNTQRVSVTRLVTLRHVYKENGGEGYYRYFLDLEMSPNCKGYWFEQNIVIHTYNDGTAGFVDFGSNHVGTWQDASGIHLNYEDYEPWRINGKCNFGVWAVSQSGDTVPMVFMFDTVDIDTISVPHITPNQIRTATHGIVVNGKMNAWLSFDDDTLITEYRVAAIPKVDFKHAVRTYCEHYTQNGIGLDFTGFNYGGDTNIWRLELDKVYLGFCGGQSLYNHLTANYVFSTYNNGNHISLPIVQQGGDSTTVLIIRDNLGIVRVYDLGATSGINGQSNYWSSVYDYVDYKYYGDSTLQFKPYGDLHHFCLLRGSVANNINSVSAATTYYNEHSDELECYTMPSIPIDYDNWWGSTEYINPERVIIDIGSWETGWYLSHNNHMYKTFLFPFKADGTMGTVSWISYWIVPIVAKIEPAGDYLDNEYQWYTLTGDSVLWRWRYTELDEEHSHHNVWHRAVLKAGTIDSLADAMGTTTSGVLPTLQTLGLVKSWLPDETGYLAIPQTDSISGLDLYSNYEVCLWTEGWNYGLGCLDTAFQSTIFSTDVPEDELFPIVVSMEATDYDVTSETTVPQLTVSVNEKTAYWHLIFGENSELAALGIRDIASAKAYSLNHTSELVAHTENEYDLYFVGNNQYNNLTNTSTRTISPDSIYRAYVIPYGTNGQPGVARRVAFSWYSSNWYSYTTLPYSYYGITTWDATNITDNSAVLNGVCPPRLKSPYYVQAGFLLKKNGETTWDTLMYNYHEEDSIAIAVNGLEANTTYTCRFICKYKYYNSYNNTYSYYYTSDYTGKTFTTSNCYVSAVMDTSVCYNGSFHGQQYTADQQIVTNHTSAQGCDSVLTVNLHVLPLRTGYDTLTLCYGASFSGATHYADTTMTQVITEEGLCDSIVYHSLHILPQRIGYNSMTLCYGEVFEGEARYANTDVTHIIPQENACDSTNVISLTVRPQNSVIEEIESCNSYVWKGTTYTASTNTPTETTTDIHGCDSITTLHLTVHYNNSAIETIFACDSFSWHGVKYTSSVTSPVFDTLNIHGCDSTTTLHLTLNHSSSAEVSTTACNSYIWYGTEYTASTNTPTHTLLNNKGCDSVVTLNLTVIQCSSSNIMACGNYTWHNTTYYTSGTYVDGVDTLHLTINNPVHTAVTEIACDSLTWNGTVYSVSGEYTYSHFDNNGCTQVDTLYLTLNYPIHTSTIEVACDSFAWNGISYTTSGDYTYSHTDNNSCIQVDSLHLAINNSIHIATTEAVCDSFIWQGTTYTTSGNYYYTHLDTNGCTQVDTLHLTINSPIHIATTESACDSFTWNGTTYFADGNFTYTHLDNNGCTQTDTLHLTINNPVNTAITETACDHIVWNDTSYTASGDYTFIHADANSCTQVDTLHLTVHFSSTGIEIMTACNVFEWHGTEYTTSTNEPTFTSTNAAGCDSVTTLHLTINHCSTTSLTVCDSYTWHGTTYTTSGEYYYGTDTLQLTVNYSNTGIDERTACDSSIWHGNIYTANTQTPTFTETNVNGCDSLVTLHLAINQSNVSETTVTACDSFNWYGVNYTADTNATHTLTNSMGCDSTITLNLTINYSNTGDTSATVCDNFLWYDTTYTASGTPTHVFTNTAGCDSTITLNLTINYSTTGIENVTVCENYTWHGNPYIVSGTPIFDTINAAGCDSTVTLNLTINNPVHIATTETSCETYTWNGITYTASGDYTYSHADANNCTQVDTLHLTINHSNTGDTMATACDSFTWYGTTYTTSATPTHVFTNAAGCDSTVTLNLTVNQSTTGSETATACESYYWSGQWLVVSGQYFDTNTNAAGCDSIVTLTLTINNPVHTATTEVACDSYTWNDITHTTSGDYTYSHLDANGCTQVDTLHLTINTPVHTATTETACETFDWNGTAYTTTGDYTYSHTDANGCTQVDTLHLTINNGSHNTESETVCDSYTWHGNSYAESGTYTYDYTNSDGCASVDTLLLSVHYSVETTFTDTAEESYTWNGTTYTESGTYQWLGQTAEGCDSTVTLNLTVTHVGIDDVDNDAVISIHVSDGRIVVGANNDLPVRVYDVTGRQYPTFTSHVSPFTLSDGVYLVKVGSYPARRVVVIR